MGLAVYSLKLKLLKHALCDRLQRTFIENTKPFRTRLTRATDSQNNPKKSIKLLELLLKALASKAMFAFICLSHQPHNTSL